MLQNLTGWHALIILAIVLLVFGAAKLPALAKSVGQSVRILKTEAVDAAPAPVASPAGDPSDAPTTRTTPSPGLAP
ncbi:twin-arginine translocase TatA/TatE family subunit [Microbacterium sp. cx-55]|uniref:Sec-independent protein translocase subunit TatA/TatB n=1 Tax=unclassified Microbacterium TaxID=2609290 RepID=UPI001CC08827|nr:MULTISPECIES: twin-arginine translocase TatA/TatE family subunit [unclassified Microbacterium]MBZ4487584.1 twin-arginine translocase TatA/TatE family subunit [Microbacterium sp. cx-55]MCC4908267.1 twin-arginine translocase TatA/TatE family subunit [Microbacterium sp. cx-59]UGB35602.1 twin-arginine translocase TatA/TatE family subunit [Microbacterium sp. cx-55]